MGLQQVPRRTAGGLALLLSFRSADKEVEDRAEEWDEDNHNHPDEFVGVVASQTVNEGYDPEDKAKDVNEVIDIHRPKHRRCE